MIFRSLQWRLQAWHGLILLVVLAGFGFTAHQIQRANEFRRVDQELQQRVGALLAALHSGRPPGHLPGGGRAFPEGRGLNERPSSGPPMDRGDDVPMPPGFRLPPEQRGLFEGDAGQSFYYAVWRRDGQQLDRSTNAPADLAMPERDAGLPGAYVARTRGASREVFFFTPPGECLLAGRSITPELAGFRRSALWMAVLGAGVLALGLAGGWWLATRAIRPIDDISAAAAKIAAGNLSHRISSAATDNELGRLAGVLNSTFARLEAAFTQQARFTADASHELRTPVSVILSQTQAALVRERSAGEYRESLEACQRAAQRMRRLIDNLLELARLDDNHEPMKSVRFDLARTATDCVELIRPLAAECRVTIAAELQATDCCGDPERVAQVITNLLANAVHYNREGGAVHVATRSENGCATLSVRDSGPGIAAEHLPHIFERFYRADSARTTSHNRSGLGLAITKAIIDAHGGTIEVSSKADTGTTFVVRLLQEAGASAPPAKR
jgi:signal transduction histidine kinase